VSWVYVIGSRDGSTVKIGRGHPKKRLSSLRVGSAEDLRIIAAKASLNARDTERRIHQGLRRSYIRGEWFRRTDEVERFLRVFRRARMREVDIYVARLLKEERCSHCGVAIDLDAVIRTETAPFYCGTRQWAFYTGRVIVQCSQCPSPRSAADA
jgi:hypothetical protein